jgi:heme exporter protein C
VKNWWKFAGVLLVLYSIFGGLLIDVPRLPILHETIRNLYFHVTMWFAMMAVLCISLYGSIRYLATFEIKHDLLAVESAKVGMMFGTLGLLTGMVWANYTWGAPWVNDAKLNGAAGTMLVYAAYFLLRGSMEDEQKRARISAVYNIFALVMMFVFIMVLPRMVDSLHPGNGGNPGFGKYDLDNKMRLVFWPAILGWIMIGAWMIELNFRLQKIKRTTEE